MDRTSTLYELARVCRGSHPATLWALAYATQGMPTAELSELLSGAQEAARAYSWPSTDHLAAYRERWGRVPDGS